VSSGVSEVRLRVRYAETDQMGVVYHANYFIWFEVGRVEFLRQLGISYREMEQNHHCSMAVVDARCRYRAPARYDDEIIVRTRLKSVRETLVHFGYELVRASDHTLLAEGETTHLAIDGEMKVRAIPENYMNVFRGTLAGKFDRSPQAS
jgi:acyl-CoA thioester hydrolase